ncbi:GAF sensor signal transduction histidine kinase [Chondrocystis sp. NIES-4102]|nr:GAF sensor signal transduction histidine kinase [Chondrocystis sp. NIES-4102]
MSNNHLSSNEFATICQSQITLLSNSLGAVWSVVYLAEEVNEGKSAQLFPFTIYPQTEDKSLFELPVVRLSESWQQLQSQLSTQLLPANFVTASNHVSSAESNYAKTKQLIVPLIHQETFIGLLVTGREDRQWQPAELEQVEEVARTLAIARYLELQYHWTKEELIEQKNLRRVEQDRLDNLLHQLRNPLTALRTFSKLLLKRLLPEDPKHQLAQSLLKQSDRFQELLEQFEADAVKDKDVSATIPRLPGSENTVAPSNFLLPSAEDMLNPVDLNLLLEPLLDTARAIAEDRKIELKSNIAPDLPQIQGDASALREIFTNLIDNALKYTPLGGRIQLDLVTKANMLGIAIRDTGYGIPLGYQSRIFERHYRGMQAQSNIPGTGLGLAIAHELVTRMQGEIELISPNSLSPDSPGTTFIVWLPLSTHN